MSKRQTPITAKGPRGGVGGLSKSNHKPESAVDKAADLWPKVTTSKSKLQNFLAEDQFRKGRLPANNPRRQPTLPPIKLGGES
jgi:hypothetical protein